MNNYIYIYKHDLDYCMLVLRQLIQGDYPIENWRPKFQLLLEKLREAERVSSSYGGDDLMRVFVDRELAYSFGRVLCASGNPRCVMIGHTIIGQIDYITWMN